jgi:hypothetical protein
VIRLSYSYVFDVLVQNQFKLHDVFVMLSLSMSPSILSACRSAFDELVTAMSRESKTHMDTCNRVGTMSYSKLRLPYIKYRYMSSQYGA